MPSWRPIATALAVALAVTASATRADAQDTLTLPSAAAFRIAPHRDRLSLLALPSLSGADIDFGFARAPRLSLRHVFATDFDRSIPITGTRTASALLVMSCSW